MNFGNIVESGVGEVLDKNNNNINDLKYIHVQGDTIDAGISIDNLAYEINELKCIEKFILTEVKHTGKHDLKEEETNRVLKEIWKGDKSRKQINNNGLYDFLNKYVEDMCFYLHVFHEKKKTII